VHTKSGSQEFAGLGLDVVDLLLPEPLDARDL